MPHFVPFLGTERRCAEVLARAGADSHWRTAPACTAGAFLHLSGYPWKRIRPLILRLYMPPRGAALTTSATPPTNLVSLDPRSFAAAWPAAAANVTASDAGAAALRALELHVLAPLVGLAIGTGRKLVVPTLPRRVARSGRRLEVEPPAGRLRPRAPLGVAAHRARARLLQGGRRSAPRRRRRLRRRRARNRPPRCESHARRHRAGGVGAGNPRRPGGARVACARAAAAAAKRRRPPPADGAHRCVGAAADRQGGALEEGARRIGGVARRHAASCRGALALSFTHAGGAIADVADVRRGGGCARRLQDPVRATRHTRLALELVRAKTGDRAERARRRRAGHRRMRKYLNGIA